MIFFSGFVMHHLNQGISTPRFPDILKKWQELKPVFKKESRIDKHNYRAVSALLEISNTFERFLSNCFSNQSFLNGISGAFYFFPFWKEYFQILFETCKSHPNIQKRRPTKL